MALDIQIFENKTGLVGFDMPKKVTSGINKLIQKVVILLLADEGELINYTGGAANTNTLDNNVLVGETARVIEKIRETTPSIAPNSERIKELVLAQLQSDGSSAVVDISVTSLDDSSTNIILNI